MRCMVEYISIKILHAQQSYWPMTHPFIIGLPYDYPYPSGSWQSALKTLVAGQRPTKYIQRLQEILLTTLTISHLICLDGPAGRE
jgi:hypothetical protein